MTTVHSHYVTYDRRLSRPNTFIWIAEDETIRCRLQVAGAAEVSPVDVHLRFRGRGPQHDLVHARPIDGATFLCEAAIIDSRLPKLELVLRDVPEVVAEQIRHL